MGHPSERIVKLPPEQEAIRTKCFHSTGTFVEFANEETEQSISARFEKIVRQRPEGIAVKDSHQSWTYATLDAMANRVARAIVQRQGGMPGAVGLLFEKGAPLIASMLGVLKAGKFFVLLDPSFPKARNTNVLDDSRADLVIFNRQNLSLAQEVAGSNRHRLEFESIDCGLATEDLGLTIPPQALALVVHTSGSTGQPKGVVHTHRNVLHDIMLRTNAYHVCAHDRLSLLAAGTSSAINNTFLALLNGAALLPFDTHGEGLTRLARWLSEESISICWISSPLFRSLAATLTGNETFRDLRLLRLASDAVYQTDVGLYKRYFPPQCLLANGIAPTETGLLTTYVMDHETEIVSNDVPLGYAVEGTDILLLDETGTPLGPDEIGEIAVRSSYLAVGYWQRPDETKAKFIPDVRDGQSRVYLTGDLGLMASDGCLRYKGRKDFRVKIRGYGVEIAEVELALRSHPAIRDAVVVGRPNELGEAQLVAYLACAGRRGPYVSELRSFLLEKLPHYMIPSAFVRLESIPLTPNGKIDRKALPDPERNRPHLATAYAPPRDEIDLKLVHIWEEVLDLRPIGIDDNFFDLGGHSLVAAKLFARLDEAFGRSLPLGVLFNAPTVRALAEHYQSAPTPKARSPIVPIWSRGSLPPIFAVPGVFGNVLCFAELSRELGSDQPFYALQSTGLDGAEAPLDSIEAMASLYVTEIRQVQSHGPYALIGVCFGARVAYEMARQLLEAKEPVAFLGLVDPSRREGYDTGGNAVARSQLRKRATVLSSFVADRLRLYMDEMRDLGGAKRIGFLANKIRSLASNIADSGASRRIHRELHQLEVFLANKEASKRYHRKPLSEGLQALESFATSSDTTGWSFDWKYLWRGHPVGHQVPGKDSGDMLRGENARILAGLLAKRLRAAFTEEGWRDAAVRGR